MTTHTENEVRFTNEPVQVWYAGLWGNRLDVTWSWCDTDEERVLAVYEASARAGLRVIYEGTVRLKDDGGFTALGGWGFQGTGCGMHLSPELSAGGVWDQVRTSGLLLEEVSFQ